MKFHDIDVVGRFRLQRLTTAQRISIINPQSGRLVYDTTNNTIYSGDGSSWNEIGSGGGGGGSVAMEIESFTTGTPINNYTGSTTVFDLSVFTYVAGSTQILVFSDSLMMKLGSDYMEDGSGDKITFLTARATGEEVCIIKIDAVAGVADFIDLGDVPSSYVGQAGRHVAVNMAETGLEFVTPSASDLQSTLAAGNTTGGTDIVISTGDSIVSQTGSNDNINITPDGTGEINLNKNTNVTGDLTVNGKLTVSGLIDPTGMEFAPVAANPGLVPANTIWIDSGDSKLKIDSNEIRPLVNQNLKFGDGSEVLNSPDLECLSFGATDDVFMYFDNALDKLIVNASGITAVRVNGDFEISGKLTVDGLIDPTGLELVPQVANPGITPANTLWLDSGDSNKPKIGSNALAFEEDLQSNIFNGGGKQWGYIQPASTGSPTTLGATGILTDVTYTGTGGTVSVTNTGIYKNLNSTLSIWTDNIFSIDQNLRVVYKIIWLDAWVLAGRGFYCGFSDTPTYLHYNADLPGYNYFGVQILKSRSDVNFQFISKDGVTQEITDTGIAPVNGSVYYFELLSTSTDVKLNIYDSTYTQLGATITHSTNIPTIDIGWEIGVTVADVGFYHSSIEVTP